MANKDISEIEEFYQQINKFLKITEKPVVALIIGDFNAKR